MIRLPRIPLHDLSRRVSPAEVLATRAAHESEALRMSTFAISAKVQDPRRARRPHARRD